MKRILLFAGVVLLCACTTTPRQYRDYSKQSGFEIETLDSATVDNLGKLARVWGYVKYHHPRLSDNTVDMDFELFELLPQVTTADNATFERILCEWIDSLGSYKPGKPETIEPLPFGSPPTDLDWTANAEYLGEGLSKKLTDMRFAKRSKNYYVSNNDDEQPYKYPNPWMGHEKPYNGIKNPDYGYRLLAVFRFWNMIEYFFPSKYITDTPWNEVLPKYISRMHGERCNYRNEAWRMIAEIDDSHGIYYTPSTYGKYRPSIHTKFIGNELVVCAPDTIKAGSSPFRSGDKILAVNGRTLQKFMKGLKELTPCSHIGALHIVTADAFLRTHDSTQIEIRYSRNGIERDTMSGVSSLTGSYGYYYEPNKLEGYRMIGDSICYINSTHYKNADRNTIIEKFGELKGIIVDMRGYPRENLYGFINEYMADDDPDLNMVCVTPKVSLPGTFTIERGPGYKRSSKSFRGSVIMLVDESTQSHAEYCTMAVQRNPNVVTIGTQSAGADGNVTEFTLPGGIKSRFSGLGVYYPDGRQTQRVGVHIDQQVEQTVQDLIDGKDTVLEAAIALCK